MDGTIFDTPDSPSLGGISSIDRNPFELFLYYEARLLDLRKFWDWKSLFTEDGAYWVPASANQKDPFSAASLFYDDAQLMTTRFERLEHPRIHVQSPQSRTAHMISNVVIEAADEKKGEFLISSSMTMTEYRQDIQRVFAGYQYHRLKRNNDSFLIRLKRVDLINCDSAFEAMALPI